MTLPPDEVEIEAELIDYVVDAAVGALSGRHRPYPHPLVTDALLERNLIALDQMASEVQHLASLGARGRAGLAARVAAGKANPMLDLLARQQRAVVDALHQLDHRTRFERHSRRPDTVTADAGSPGRRLAVLKPELGTTGGFEAVVAQLADELVSEGWQPQIVAFDAHSVRRSCFGLPVGPAHVERHPELWHYLFALESLSQLDLSEFDVVLATQPPSYLVNHPRVAALFYHQPRAFFDLADEFERAGFAQTSSHEHAVRSIRRVEELFAPRVRHWFAGSAEAASRLERFFDVGPDSVSVIYPGRPDPSDDLSYDATGPVVTVGRHEWPKRVELAVAAAHAWTADNELVVVGTGSRLERSQSLDAELGSSYVRHDELGEAELWVNQGASAPGWRPSTQPASGRVRFVTDASNQERDALYRSASVVVCPAYQEDHGLTPLEAMAAGRPVVVCRDGGGLTEFVEDGVTGLVATPTPAGIADAVDRLVSNPEQARQMGLRGRDQLAAISGDGKGPAATVAAVLDELFNEPLEHDAAP